MSFRFFLFIPLCLMLYGCGISSAEELSLDEAAEEESSVAEDTQSSSESVSFDKMNDNICVYVCGRVRSPGVFVLPAGSRVYEALALAGGILEEADERAVNQAGLCSDGEMIYVPAVGEAGESAAEGTDAAADDGRIDINSADSSELQKLKGIGASRAEDIVSYREKNGKFDGIESIMEVPGIKQGTFDKIKDQIKAGS